MKIINTAELDIHDIEHLRALANVNCENVFCCKCPLNVNTYENMQECIKDIANLCLRKNNINTERSENERND